LKGDDDTNANCNQRAVGVACLLCHAHTPPNHKKFQQDDGGTADEAKFLGSRSKDKCLLLATRYILLRLQACYGAIVFY